MLKGKLSILKKIFFFWPRSRACGILTPQPVTEPMHPAVEAWSLNHWTAGEIPLYFLTNTSYLQDSKKQISNCRQRRWLWGRTQLCHLRLLSPPAGSEHVLPRMAGLGSQLPGDLESISTHRGAWDMLPEALCVSVAPRAHL